MPYEISGDAPRRIAIIGAGIAGMGAAYRLGARHAVTLFEAEPRLGGHARTVLAGKRGDQPVDTGFIVFNYATYPHLTALFAELDVPIADSSMTFAASIADGRLEYALNTLNSLFGQRRNTFSPGFAGMLRDILRFNARAEALALDESLTIGGLLDKLGTGTRFRDHYLLPFSGAIWSTPTQEILDFPAAALVRFFRNHALLGLAGQHKWYTVRGGSIEYVRRLEAAMRRAGVEIRTGSPIARVERGDAPGARVKPQDGEWDSFDEVIFATHGDVSLRLLGDADAAERAALAGVRYHPNTAVLHSDASLMPRRRRCWASWNYTEAAGGRDAIGLTYWMNSLQPIPMGDPLFVTLNPTRPIDPSKVHDRTSFSHPMYTQAMLGAQRAVGRLNGRRNTWFCGAWMRNGFHEDGLASALDVVRGIEDSAKVLAA